MQSLCLPLLGGVRDREPDALVEIARRVENSNPILVELCLVDRLNTRRMPGWSCWRQC